VSQYQKGKTDLDFTEARDSEWQWHQLGDMQVCTSLQTDNHASTPPLKFLQAAFLPPNQQRQSTEGTNSYITKSNTQKLCIFLTGGAYAPYATCMATPASVPQPQEAWPSCIVPRHNHALC